MVKGCPFCENPRKSYWYYDGESDCLIVADDAEKEHCLICFTCDHAVKAFELRYTRKQAIKLLTGVARAIWGRDVELRFDWEQRQYNHSHVQVFKVGADSD